MVPGAAVVGSVVPASERKPLMTLWPSKMGHDRAGEHELHERLVERLAHVLLVVCSSSSRVAETCFSSARA